MNETVRAVREAASQPNPASPQVSGTSPSVRLRGRRHRGPGPRAILAAALVHLVVVLFGWLGVTERRQPLPEFTTYRVNLVSPAPPPPAPVVPEAPATPPTPQRIAPPPPQATPPERQQPPPPPQRQVTPPQREPPTATQQREQQETRRVGEALNVNILGDEFPFPAYLENIIRQVQNFFRPPAGGARDLVAEVYFVILPDGSVEDIRVASPSRSMPFNLQAMAAVEQAGNRRAFGPFPDGFEAPRLPVLFSFKPLQ